MSVLTLLSFCSLLYGPQSVTHKTNKMYDGRNITLKALYFANSLTANWAEAGSVRHSAFNKHNLHFTAMFFLGNISTKLPPSSLPSRCIELASYACALAQL